MTKPPMMSFAHPSSAQEFIKSKLDSLMLHFQSPAMRVAVLTLFYLAILLALVALYTREGFVTPPFIYQGY